LATTRRAVEAQKAAEQAALRADKEARSHARVEGKPQPTPTAPAVSERLDAALKARADLQDDLPLAQYKLDQAIEANRADIERQIGQALAKARKEYRNLLEALGAKHAEMVAREAELSWLGRGKYIPAGERRVEGLLRPNGEPMSVSELLAALEARGEPPKPKVIQAPASPLSQTVAGRGVFVS
jgi:hypothetical protein